MSDTLAHYGVKGMRRGTRKSREERNAERRAKYEAKLKAKYGDNDIGKIETYLKIRKEHAEKVKKWRQANQRNRQLTATERREKYYGEMDRGKLGKTYSTDATLAEAARKFYKKGHNKRMGHSELMHFGVKGMKWGVRKSRIKKARRWSSGKQAKIDGMSDDQLRRINNRIRLEREYRQLTQTRSERYRSKVGKAAEEAAFNTLQGFLQKGFKQVAARGGTAAIRGAKRFKHSEAGMSDNLFFIDEDEVLAHHGVKGMKWGVRKQRPSGGAGSSRKKRKGLSRKQKAAIAGVLGTAAAVGAGYYLHKSGNGKKIAAAARKHGASARDFAKGKGRNLGAQARVKRAQAKRLGLSARGKASTAQSYARGYGKVAVGGAKGAASRAGSAIKGGASTAKAYGRGYGKVAVGGAKGAASRLGSAAKSAGGTAKAYARGYGKVAVGGAKGAASRAGSAIKGGDRSYFAGKKAVQTTRKYAKNKAVQAAVAGAGVGTAANVGMRYAANKALNGGGKKRRRRRR